MLESAISLDPDYYDNFDFPTTDAIVWLLGKSYSGRTDRDKVKRDIASRIWLTYRKNFPAIGGTGPTTDQGWGCMLRCGQMMLAQALIVRHLSRDWLWNPQNLDPAYITVLRMFQDKKNRLFSLHQIAQMGVSEGKPIGEWFGPNTVAHVLKKLVIYDDWSNIAIHVAMDNTVIAENIRKLCRTRVRCVSNSATYKSEIEPHTESSLESTAEEIKSKEGLPESVSQLAPIMTADGEPFDNSNVDDFDVKTFACFETTDSGASSSSASAVVCSSAPAFPLASCQASPKTTASCNRNSLYPSLEDVEPCYGQLLGDSYKRNPEPGSPTSSRAENSWRPLLLIVPLRLGLSSLNAVYANAIKEFFMLKYCVGIIGGRPNHALYFIGFVGDELIYLDPHECQSVVDLDLPIDELDDGSYHSPFILRMALTNIDPSLALSFFCNTEEDFSDLCNCFRKSVLKASNPPLFELLDTQPPSWPKFVPYTGEVVPSKQEFTLLEPQYDSEDEDFELLL